MNKIKLSPHFRRESRKILKKGIIKRKQLEKVLEKISKNPFEKSLRTHKVSAEYIDPAYSSYISGEYRIIWDLNSDKTITLHSIGTHKKVYK
ncbi:hypothetical protein HON22_02300 [Candidatus Peregrinibacteria bacterium]|nr:hypothetical protein [Candidatus Peregrinibacteria bacterium]